MFLKLIKLTILTITLFVAIGFSMVISYEIEHWYDEVLWRQEFERQGFEYPGD